MFDEQAMNNLVMCLFQFSQVAHQINFNPQISAKESLKMECKSAEISLRKRQIVRGNMDDLRKILQSQYS